MKGYLHHGPSKTSRHVLMYRGVRKCFDRGDQIRYLIPLFGKEAPGKM
jgi:hypothetical protein